MFHVDGNCFLALLPFGTVTAQALRKRATERKRMRLVAEVWSEIDQRQALAHNRDEPSRKVPRLSERTTARASLTRTVAQSARQK